MQPMLDPIRMRARAAYDAAADRYDDAALGLLGPVGRADDRAAGPPAGDDRARHGLRLGASSLPAARRVGPTGKVIGIDLSERMLAMGRDKARRAGLSQIEFRSGV